VRRIRCAATLDGFTADLDSGYGWAAEHASIAPFAKFDTFVIGRKTGGHAGPG
jgi:hypothetical protein